MRCQSTVRSRLFGSVAGTGRIILIEPILSDRHLDLPVLDGYRIGAHAQPGRGEALTSHDIELDAMPRAGDDLTLAHPLEFPVSRGGASHRAVDRPRAEWTELMGTDIGKGVKLSVHIEDADLDASQLEHAMRPRRKLSYRPHNKFSHLRPHHPSYNLPTGAVMPNSCSAFSPMILRLASPGIGSFMIVRGWSKSWCGQSDAKRIRSGPPMRSMVATRSFGLSGSSIGCVANHIRSRMYSLGRCSRNGTMRRYSLKYLSIRHIM